MKPCFGSTIVALDLEHIDSVQSQEGAMTSGSRQYVCQMLVMDVWDLGGVIWRSLLLAVSLVNSQRTPNLTVVHQRRTGTR